MHADGRTRDCPGRVFLTRDRLDRVCRTRDCLDRVCGARRECAVHPRRIKSGCHVLCLVHRDECRAHLHGAVQVRDSKLRTQPHDGRQSFHQKSTCLHTFDFRASCGANLVTQHPRIGGNEAVVVHRVDCPRLKVSRRLADRRVFWYTACLI